MEFIKQANIYNPEDSNVDITIAGVGSTGSFVALNLAKMGISDIKIIDFDKVEDHNIPNQFFRLQDIDKQKVDALSEIIKDFTGTEVKTENIEIDEDYDFKLTLNSIVILAVDSMDARKLIYNKLKDFPIKIIDTRFGGEGYSIHLVDLSNEEDKAKFEKSLNLPAKETSCGEKGIIYTILSLASEICNIVKRLEKNQPTTKILRREMTTYRFIHNQK